MKPYSSILVYYRLLFCWLMFVVYFFMNPDGIQSDSSLHSGFAVRLNVTKTKKDAFVTFRNGLPKP